MKVKNMTNEEIQRMAIIAEKLFNTFEKDKNKLSTRQAFILGFLHGRDYSLEELGFFDDSDDDSKIYKFVKNNPEMFNNK